MSVAYGHSSTCSAVSRIYRKDSSVGGFRSLFGHCSTYFKVHVAGLTLVRLCMGSGPYSSCNLFLGLWDTTEMKPGEEREVIVRTSLRELIIYIVFLAILCIGERGVRTH